MLSMFYKFVSTIILPVTKYLLWQTYGPKHSDHQHTGMRVDNPRVWEGKFELQLYNCKLKNHNNAHIVCGYIEQHRPTMQML
jgi:hypothetical protein